MKPFLIMLIFIGALALFFLWQYVFSIYEVLYKMEPDHLFVSSDSVLKIESVAVNAFGFKAPFRKAPFTYEWEMGEDLIEIVEDKSESGYMVVRSKTLSGKAVLKVKGKYTLLPSLIEIRILANLTDINRGVLP